MLDRAAIIQTLSAAVRADPDVRAAWLGGSDANGRADERSDVDLFLVVRPGSVDAVAERLETGLAALSPIRLRLRLPHPTWQPSLRRDESPRGPAGGHRPTSRRAAPVRRWC